MKTLKELRAKYKQLKKESDDIYNQIRLLEKKEILSNFTVGNCYFDIEFNTLIKIVAISNSYVYYICVDKDYIGRDSSYIYNITGWVKITSEQFKKGYLLVLKNIQDPNWEIVEEHNWSDFIIEIINKE
jgi:hypothetical protein|nr:MAG TPA: hypothetical protein [Crassvirales sp.]